MAKEAERLLEDSRWLPEPLRTPNRPFALTWVAEGPEPASVESAGEGLTAAGDETAMGEAVKSAEDEPAATEPSHNIAAE
jgi:ParB family chromosome partitioning protein